jgi:hypothetical protein
MKRTFIILLFASIILQSCSPKIRTSLSNNAFKALDDESEILIIKENEKIPVNSNFIGELKIGDSGFSTDCGYTKVIDDAKETAKKSGANLIHLTEVKKPNFGSTCYRIKAKLYRNLNLDALAQISESRKFENKSRLPSDADYAVVYFYRPKIFTGSMIGFKVRIDDETVIGRVRNGEKFEYKISDFGKHEFWGKTESRTSVIIDIEKGQEYFVRCGINMGIAVGRPEMYVVENELGISEYESLKEKKKK